MKFARLNLNYGHSAWLPLAIALPLWFVAGRVDASCGDYVTIEDAMANGHQRHAEDAPLTPGGMSHRSAPPCSGPHCSRMPSQPTPPPATTTMHVQQWLISAPPVAIARGASAAAVSFEPAAYSSIQAAAIFHPPRMGGAGLSA
jgi:hypothetical protein